MSKEVKWALLFMMVAVCSTLSAEDRWIDFGASRTPVPAGVAVVSSDAEALNVDFEVRGLELQSVQVEGRHYTRVEIPGAGQIGAVGTPRLPAFRRFVELPEGATLTSDVEVLEWQTVKLAQQGFEEAVLPVQRPRPKCDCKEYREWTFSYDETAYRGTVGHELVSWEAPIRMRDHRMVKLTIAPVQYDADQGVLRVASRVRLGLNFEGGDVAATMAARDRLSSRAFDAFLGRSTLNLGFHDPNIERGAGWHYPDDAPIEFLIITPPAFLAALEPFAAWKTTCGYRIHVVTTDVTGTTKTDIKAYISGLYAGPHPPVYILMIGDSPNPLATFTSSDPGVSSGGYGGTDLPYVQMDGDIYPDMMISRWPVDDVTELVNMRDKILHYEQPTAANSAWLHRALFLAGDDYENNNVTTHEDVIAELMAPPPNSADVDLWHGTDNPTTAQLIADLNTGRAWAVYSAHSGTSGWSGDPPLSSGDIPNMNNTDMYPIGIGHSCSSNEWATTSDVFGEVSVTHPSKGFVSYWGGSNSTHWVGDDWLQRGYFDALFDADMNGSQIPDLDGQYSNVAICYAGLTSVDLQGGDDEVYYWYMYNLDGDPTLDPFTRLPGALNVGAPPAIGPTATDSFTVTVTDSSNGAVPGALVGASQNGFLLGAGYTDGSGVAVFAIQAPAAGVDMLVRVTAHNHLPTDASVMVGADTAGIVTLDSAVYPCGGLAVIDVFDTNAAVPFSVNLGTGVASTIVAMTEVGDIAGHYQGIVQLGVDLAVAHGDVLTAEYEDVDDGTGATATRTALAVMDCLGPAISNVQVAVAEDSITVSFDTDEPGTTEILYGEGTPPATPVVDPILRTNHTVTVDGLTSCTDYFIQVGSNDAFGNQTIDSNGGLYYAAETAGWVVFFEDDLSSNPGWVINNNGSLYGWAYGVPQGGGGEYGGPDPTSGFTGLNVYGVNLAGDYENNLLHDELQLTTPVIDCSEAISVTLRFMKWLGVESPTFDHARVEVTTNGGLTWIPVWENTAAVEDSGWSEQIVDLTALAAGMPNLQVRWTMGSTDTSWRFCGWNIDDVVIEGEAPCPNVDPTVIFDDAFETGDCSKWSAEVN